MLETGLIVVHVVCCVVLVTLVLMQQGRGAEAGAALGAGASASVFGARGSATFLSRSTAAIAMLLLATSLGLNGVYVHRGQGASVTERYPTQTPASAAKPKLKPGASSRGQDGKGSAAPLQQDGARPQGDGSPARPADIPDATAGHAGDKLQPRARDAQGARPPASSTPPP